MRTEIAFLVAAGFIGAAPLGAQSTGLPSFNAPYRAFQRSEFGGVLSFPNPGGTAFEGAYRYASGDLDVGVRGGFHDPAGVGRRWCWSGPRRGDAGSPHRSISRLEAAWGSG